MKSKGNTKQTPPLLLIISQQTLQSLSVFHKASLNATLQCPRPPRSVTAAQGPAHDSHRRRSKSWQTRRHCPRLIGTPSAGRRPALRGPPASPPLPSWQSPQGHPPALVQAEALPLCLCPTHAAGPFRGSAAMCFLSDGCAPERRRSRWALNAGAPPGAGRSFN